MTKRLVAGGLLLVFAGGAAGAIVAIVLTRGSSETRPQPRATGTIGLEGRELLTLLGRGRAETFHAIYRVRSTNAAARDQRLTIELWRKPPREREDTIIDAGPRSGRTSGFLEGARTVLCTKAGTQPWSCRRAPEGAATTGAAALLESITTQLRGRKVAARDETIQGRTARCFVMALELGDADLCVNHDGIPIRISAGDTQFELVTLEPDVPDSVFELPATPA